MHISEVNIYPVKSLKGISLSESKVERRGLRFDRRWMLTDLDGTFFTQRETPKMATITVEVTGDGLRATSENHGEMAIPGEPDRGLRQNVTVWQSEVPGEVYVGEVSEWFSEVLGRKCQLVIMPEGSERHVSPQFDTGNDIVSFADGYPLLLLGEPSVKDLNDRLLEKYHDDEYAEHLPLPMNRFRPNVVVHGSEAFEEGGWAKIRIGEAVFRVPKPCARCVMTTIDQARGEFDGKEPLQTMASYRLAKQVHPETFESLGQTATAVLFGENLIPENPGGVIRVGDEVEVLAMR